MITLSNVQRFYKSRKSVVKTLFLGKRRDKKITTNEGMDIDLPIYLCYER